MQKLYYLVDSWNMGSCPKPMGRIRKLSRPETGKLRATLPVSVNKLYWNTAAPVS